MNNKNNKNTLLQSVAYGPHAAYMALRLKASFHASPAAIMALLAKHRLHQSKNIALRAEKPYLAMRRDHFFSKEPRNQGNNIPEFLNSLDQEISRMFFSEAMFLLLDVCNNDSYVIRAVAWA